MVEMPPEPTPVLIILSGLPGTGKSTLAQRLARETGAVYLRIDTIEQALRDLCGIAVEGEGYRLAYRIARDNLLAGHDVIADSCNPIELTRREWEAVATETGGRHLNVEVVCSDPAEHRRRVEGRASEVAGLVLPSWDDVQRREYHPWDADRLVIDTAGRGIDESHAELSSRLQQAGLPRRWQTDPAP